MIHSTFSKGGIHPAACKTTLSGIEALPLPRRAVVPLQQHIGAPARPIVAKGDSVRRGQLIAEAPYAMSAAVHAPVSGTVAALEDALMPDGRRRPCIVITADEATHDADETERMRYWLAIDSMATPDVDADTIKRRVARAGIVGMGGATFPSAIKLAPRDKVDLLIINGCECEPFLTCDDALMRAYPAKIIAGVQMMMKATAIDRAVIAIEDNKPEAAAALAAHAVSAAGVEVKILRTKYPQGGERQLIDAVSGRKVPSGAIPSAVGVIVHNVATAFAVWQAVSTDMPLIERVISISGDIPAYQRRNYRAAIGTPFAEIPFTLPPDADTKIILGGPMMGKCTVTLDAPVTKGTSGITVLTDARRQPLMPCIRCGACVDACPMGLEPYLLETYGRLRRWDDARAADVADCIECGSCSWSCPSRRPLLDYIRRAKNRCRQR